jgi:uncharacterized protein YjbI with pentapeptide repeats
LRDARLDGGKLQKANLVGARLEGCSLGRCLFNLADLRDARLDGANLTYANVK